ncbi:hypothetical protein GIB67_010497, partial [Kingdonia uniflora]
MHVVPVQLPLIFTLSKIRINVPSNLRPMEERHSILLSVQELETRFPQGFPKLNPVKTSPLKVLSNQKYRELTQEFSDVGLMMGDVTISPNAICLAMKMEILRGMLYRGSEMFKEVARLLKWFFFRQRCQMQLDYGFCHVVYTDFRPILLQHYVFPVGGSGLHLVVDENEQFKEDGFVKLQDTFAKQKKQGDGNKRWNANSNGRITKNRTSSGGSDIQDCEGIAVHHSGLLRIIKEVAELLFQEGIVKALFATETFAMGLNMPVKTILFTFVRKWDGDSHRIIGSGEYIQTLLDIGEWVLKLEKEAAMLDASGEEELVEYYKLILLIAQLEKKMMSEIIRPERVLCFLLPSRLVCIKHLTASLSGEYYNSLLCQLLLGLLGATFAEVIEMTDIFEGSIIRLSRRLDEFINQLRAAAGAVGEVDLESKFAASSESLRR